MVRFHPSPQKEVLVRQLRSKCQDSLIPSAPTLKPLTNLIIGYKIPTYSKFEYALYKPERPRLLPESSMIAKGPKSKRRVSRISRKSSPNGEFRHLAGVRQLCFFA